jgi:DNA-binding HxlR family transcriptional regulator
LTPGNPVDHSECRALGDVLSRVGDKWTIFVVALLSERSMRFNELRRAVGAISQRMLTLTLKGLERDGLVTRTVHPPVNLKPLGYFASLRAYPRLATH